MRNRGFVPLIVLIFVGILASAGVLTYQNRDRLVQTANNLLKEKATPSPVPDSKFNLMATLVPTPKPSPTPNVVYVPTTKPSPTIPPLKSVTVSGFAYEDRNNDGVFNGDDPKLPNMQFALYDGYKPSIQISTVYSDSSGSFSITLSVRGGLMVYPTASNNFVPKTGNKKYASTTSGVQFGFRSASAPVANQNVGIIEGNIFQDGNRSGSRDSGENSVYFYKLYLIGSGGNYFNTDQNAQTTDQSGHFRFVNLPVPGTYTLQLSNPTGEYDISKPETTITLTSTQTENKNIEIPVFKY